MLWSTTTHSFRWTVRHMVWPHASHCLRRHHLHHRCIKTTHSLRWHSTHHVGVHATHGVWRHGPHHVSVHAAHGVHPAIHDGHSVLHIDKVHVKASLLHHSVCGLSTNFESCSKSSFWRIAISYCLVKCLHSSIQTCLYHFWWDAKILPCLTYGIRSALCSFRRRGTISYSIMESGHANFIHIWHLIIENLGARIHPNIRSLAEGVSWTHSASNSVSVIGNSSVHTRLNHIRRKACISETLTHHVSGCLSGILGTTASIYCILICCLPHHVIIVHCTLLCD